MRGVSLAQRQRNPKDTNFSGTSTANKGALDASASARLSV